MRFVSAVLFFTVAIMASASANKEKVHYDVNNPGPHFEQFIKDHNRVYADDEDRRVHYEAFVENLKKINEMNEKSPSATFGINKFADYTPEEMKSMRGFKKQ